jgi:CubicO group peptidase (beta-lactamase class C family)
MYRAFEAALDAAVAEGRVAGAVALVADRGGTTYQHAAGARAIGGAEAMTPDTVFWVASMTKAIASVAALQLVERGKLSLDGDLGDLLPDLRDLEVFDRPGPDGVWITRPAEGAVTLRQLLTHTSGFSYGFIDPRINPWLEAAGAVGGTRAWHRQPLLFDPGQGWAYGIGTDWVGIAVEAASGQRLDAYLAQHIFQPLGMIDTAFALTPQQEARKAGMHARGPEGGLVPIPFGLPSDPEVLSGGGGLYSTAADYGRFLGALLKGGAGMVSAQTMAELGAPQTGPRRAGMWTTAADTLSRDIDLYPGMKTGWGLATMITPDATAEGRSAGSLAWAGLANTYYWADPAAGKAGLILTQVLPFGDPGVLSLFADLERGAYGTA